ncbi:MAG: hypothetical protein IPG76_00260 [Acidobacteria bacterium]|nr:hypothetical protein [Acidobacteriota bacterium]
MKADWVKSREFASFTQRSEQGYTVAGCPTTQAQIYVDEQSFGKIQ